MNNPQIFSLHPDDIRCGMMKKLHGLITLRSPNLPQKTVMERLLSSAYISYMLDDQDNPFAVVAVKMPPSEYREKVFEMAGVGPEYISAHELGYAATAVHMTGNGYFQKLVKHTLKEKNIDMFATTRGEASAHVIKKFGFVPVGQPYNGGVKLFIRKPVVNEG